MQSLDLAEYNLLFSLSFTTPTFDSDVAPSFGTLLATVNVALNMLGEVSWLWAGPQPKRLPVSLSRAPPRVRLPGLPSLLLLPKRERWRPWKDECGVQGGSS